MNTDVKEIIGLWDKGYSLDKHTEKSTFTGKDQFGRPTFDTTRTYVGELLYQLKYKQDFKKVHPIAQLMHEQIVKKFTDIDFIIGMPPSKKRDRQPVTAIAERVSALSNKPLSKNLLLKPLATPQVKNITVREERLKTLMHAFALHNDVIQKYLTAHSYNVLIIDDLYDTGTSLEAVTTILKECSKIDKVYVATVTRKK
ncbi:ComF family protein [Microbulbifer sp. A4B17]|uniref:ComF family protein n=1 Tax=Microbulbifer sp. A4B17 TaxID=359370 RepID=UPI000D52BFC8|nr:ComF family protein [Microbulbifer sp. A4B17]AWF81403.1 ComF family protein [Microbulbifer sp. A4B17]